MKDNVIGNLFIWPLILRLRPTEHKGFTEIQVFAPCLHHKVLGQMSPRPVISVLGALP